MNVNWFLKNRFSNICTPITHRSIIYNSQNVEVSSTSLTDGLDKQNVVYTYNIILFSLKRKEIPIRAMK